MREVSCQALGIFFADLEARGLSVERLTAGSDYPLAHLRNKRERIEWADYVRLMKNAEEIWTEQEFVDLGGAFARSPLVRSLTVVGRLLFDARDLYFWMTNHSSGAGAQLFSCIEPAARDVAPGQVEISLSLAEGYPPCRPFFLVTQGTFATMPRLLALDAARVRVRYTDRGAVYTIHLPRGKSVAGWIKHAFTWPFVARVAARELEEANRALVARYAELEEYRDNLEAKVQARTAELRTAHDQLAETVVSLEKAQATRDRIFSNINHEIRTPLSLIRFAVTRIERDSADVLTDDGRSQLAGIGRNSQRLLQLVDGLLLLAAGQEDELSLKLRRADLAVLLRELVSLWGPAAKELGLTLDYDGPHNCPAMLDEAAFERVVANLLSNAMKFTAQGGIRVELEAGARTLELRIADTGVGIDEEARERVFQRFEQSAPAVRSGTRGSGIGLAIVRELVDGHGGTVRAEAGSPRGSVFHLSLPAIAADSLTTEPEEDRGPGAGAARRGPLAPSPAGSPPAVRVPSAAPRATILVAEDEAELLSAVCDILAEEYRVIPARDGQEALELAAAHLPDMLISDVGMPRMDGFELTRRFRELPGNRLAPVLLLTAFGNIRDRLAGFAAGAVDYVLKPFDPDELLARVGSLLALRDLALKLSESERLASLGTLSAGLAHEFRNPANGVVNAIPPLRETLPAELLRPGTPTAELLEVLEECGAQIAGLSRQLLGYAGSDELNTERAALETILHRALTVASGALHDRELQTVLGYSGDVLCSAAFMTQALANLLQNAAESAGPGGSVSLSTRSENGRLVLEIGDSGPGIPPDLRERVFEPFFTTKSPGEGTGLGLFTARQIAQKHGGSLRVVEGANGPVFRLDLPLDTATERESPTP